MSIRPARSGNKMKDIKTFTYFIPAPPHRKTGYREKEFDKIMAGFLQSGFELIDLKIQAVETGLFAVALFKASSKKVAKLDEELDFHERFKLQDQHSSPDIILEDDDA